MVHGALFLASLRIDNSPSLPPELLDDPPQDIKEVGVSLLGGLGSGVLRVGELFRCCILGFALPFARSAHASVGVLVRDVKHDPGRVEDVAERDLVIPVEG